MLDRVRIVMDFGGTKTLTKAYINSRLSFSQRTLTDTTLTPTEQVNKKLEEALLSIPSSLYGKIETEIILSSYERTPSNASEFDMYFENFKKAHPELNIISTVHDNDVALPLRLHPDTHISIAAGTGSNFWVRTKDGELKEQGRYPDFEDKNPAGGFKISYRAIQQLTGKARLNEEETRILNILEESLDKEPLTSFLIENMGTDVYPRDIRQKVASAGRAIVEEAANGNQTALEIVESEASTFTQSIVQSLNTHYNNGEKLSVILTGSVANSEPMTSIIKDSLQQGTSNEYIFYYNTAELPYSGFIV